MRAQWQGAAVGILTKDAEHRMRVIPPPLDWLRQLTGREAASTSRQGSARVQEWHLLPPKTARENLGRALIPNENRGALNQRVAGSSVHCPPRMVARDGFAPPTREFTGRASLGPRYVCAVAELHCACCSLQFKGTSRERSASAAPLGCLPSRMAATISGARQVSRSRR